MPKFGKTKTGQLVLLGKSGQDVHSIRALAQLAKPAIEGLIETFRIDAIAFAPHSIPRKIQFLKEFAQTLQLSLPTVTLIKVFAGNVPVAQKSLSKLADRIENANTTTYVKQQAAKYKRILAIDDAVGSGATLNAIAQKLKRDVGANVVVGYAITGSLKGFEVIAEV